MIKDVVIHSGHLRIAPGTFVCMVGDSDIGRRPETAFDSFRVSRPEYQPQR
jgi:hypothetical protein